jgi:hypothetical protein
MLTPKDFKICYPQFEDISEDVINRHFIDFLALMTIWIPNLIAIDEVIVDSCKGLYTAHILTVDYSFPISKDNINQGLSGGKYISEEQTPDFTVKYDRYNGADDFKSSTDPKEKQLSLRYLQNIIDKYYEYFNILIEIPRLTGPFFVQFQHTIYGERLLYNLSLLENYIWETMKKRLQTEISDRIEELRRKSPLAVLV